MNQTFEFLTPAALEVPSKAVAQDLEALRGGIASVPSASLLQHVTRIPVRHPHARDVPENDFARWVGDALQLPEVSERLAFAGSSPATSLEDLRGSLLAVLDSVPAKERKREAAEGAAFHFIEVRLVLAPLEVRAAQPGEVIEIWPWIDLPAAFYHLVEAPLVGRAEHALIPWLRARGASGLAESAEQVVSSGRPLQFALKEIGNRWRRSQIGRRLLQRAEAPELERQREARAAMVRLAGRLKGGKQNSSGTGGRS
ncbi:MAG TPA: DUF5752 family protein [Candidatus Eisenbacteria bacterium]|nr:DUF5752 family protein [Candidatus Eisenbacteria bacterium]